MILDRFQLRGKVAIVTGCDTGLGQGMALALAQAGADVVGVNVSEPRETQGHIEAMGRRFLDLRANLSDIGCIEGLVDQAKANDKLKIVGGMLGNRVLTPAEIESLATLPSLDQLRAQILGLISAPAQGIVSAVTNGVRQVVNVLDAYAKKDENAAAAEPAAA